MQGMLKAAASKSLWVQGEISQPLSSSPGARVASQAEASDSLGVGRLQHPLSICFGAGWVQSSPFQVTLGTGHAKSKGVDVTLESGHAENSLFQRTWAPGRTQSSRSQLASGLGESKAAACASVLWVPNNGVSTQLCFKQSWGGAS
jgi:hypothetical protein